MKSSVSQSEEYQNFRCSIPLKNISVDATTPHKHWRIYDCGPKSQTVPLVCLPPVSGTADVFFGQCLGLQEKGYRVIAVESPPYWSLTEWCDGFRRLLSHLHLEKVHLFGAALGGFLAQKFAEYTRSCPRVASLVLCNTFTDSSVFKFTEQANIFWLMPRRMLKKMIADGMKTVDMDTPIENALEFMSERLETLSQSLLSSRLTLNCTPAYVKPHLVNDLPVTIIDVWDHSALSQSVKDDLYKCYPQAKLAHLKGGGNFPFLSRKDEVNMHISIHLRNLEKSV